MKKLCYFINSDWYFDLHWTDRAIAARDAGYEIHIIREGANKQVISSQADSLIKISRIWA
ncbi:glycosyltransferase, partial [Raoultella ornithinolytica]